MENLNHFFLQILNMSITATYIAIAIIVIRYLIRKVPKVFSYSLWMILLFRLLSPVSFSSTFSFLNLLKPTVEQDTGMIQYIPQNIQLMKTPTVDIGINKMNDVINGSLPKATEFASMNPMQGVLFFLTIIWIIGVIGLFLYSMFSYIKITSKVETATLYDNQAIKEVMNRIGLKRKIRVFMSDQISSPFVTGFIIPRVYLPVNIPDKELSYILAHEFIHVKRFDYLIKPISYVIVILHWFNPILWISFTMLNKDMEMSCDEKVMNTLGDRIKQDYSNSLLSLAIGRSSFLQGSPLAFGESNVKSRIKNILNFKKPTIYATIIVFVLIGVIGYTLITNPMPLQMSNNFTPREIEINIDGAMRKIELKNGDFDKVASLLQYNKWEKSKMEYDLSTTTFLSDGAKKVIGLYEDVDGYTFIGLYSGFGLKNNDYYKAPIEVYSDIEKFLSNNYVRAGNHSSINLEVKTAVDKNLNIIMSSPNVSSNPGDYIRTHQEEYENILKMGDDALVYILSLFEKEEDEGLQGHIMMLLAIDLLGESNNVEQGTYTSPQEWYAKLSPYEPVKIPPFQYKSGNNIEELVYKAALNKYADRNENSVTIVASKIFGTYEKGNEFKIFTTVYYSKYVLYENKLINTSGGIVPAAIVYDKMTDDTYLFKEYIEARDGADFKKSIEEFTYPREDIAKEILEDYGNHRDLIMLMRENLVNYLIDNNLEGIYLKENNGNLVPLTPLSK